jgi:hypothetical protein
VVGDVNANFLVFVYGLGSLGTLIDYNKIKYTRGGYESRHMYTVRSEDNWKLFSPKSDPPYPSRRLVICFWKWTRHMFLEVDRVEGL